MKDSVFSMQSAINAIDGEYFHAEQCSGSRRALEAAFIPIAQTAEQGGRIFN